ncbi:P-loop containing nucleoside triphosphate hydrolase protein [Coemansia reversa NRRL 1564]|uniref:Pre-mRNA-splicing factor n=1 Tax=Coemansia reversa (strain ATCC 12441 / NRRL 1564) TaxID=763665 RepID=A0A2G5B2D3_COERN|nr:P-loop containing nucleoside triphosphate hydrolase protein [Coemansia reversa NRRL 1564]|eukprot:PIA13151.1 P-loop containing nucleoside triphosphate hydrolase protein [Coemansia reversa NRRL 1564]
MPPKKKARGGRPARGKRGTGTSTTASRRRIPARSTVVEEANLSATDQTQSATQPADNKKEETSIQELATRHWLGKSAKWSEDLVRKITLIHIVGTGYSRSNLQLLERQQYFEQYLWPCYSRGDVDSEWLVMAILLILNEKFQLRLHNTTWAVFETEEGSFARLFNDIVKLSTSRLLLSPRSAIAQFLIVCFRSIETGFVRDALMPMVSISIWHHIEGSVLMEGEFKRVPQLRKFWKHVNKKYRSRNKDNMLKQNTESISVLESQRDFVPNLIRDFLCCLFPRHAITEIGKLAYCVKFLELLADVLSQLATRRFVSLIIEDFQVVELCENSPWNTAELLPPPQRWLLRRFKELKDRLRALFYFQVDSVTGQALSDDAAKSAHYQKLIALQLAAFMDFPQQLENMAVSGVDRLGEPSVLAELLEPLDHQSLCKLADRVGIRCHPAATDLLSANVVEDSPDRYYTREFIVSLFTERFRTRPTVADQVRAISAYPSETLLFGDQYACLCYPGLSVPKLNLQFLSLHDYLLRSFELFRLESAYGIREDIVDAIRRLQPQVTYDVSNVEDGRATNTHFTGWTRMALPMRSFDVTDVRHPRIGEKAPSLVRADISVDLTNYVESIVNEWDSEVHAHDVLILCSVLAKGQPGDADNYVVRTVRGCEVECRLDAKGQPIDERADEDVRQGNRADTGRMRYFRVLLDKHQYYSDIQQDSDVYASLNVVLRRRPQENNFKGALESIRELMLQPAPLPDWFSSTFLGYGDPAAAAALSLQKQSAGSSVYQVEFGDTFVNEEHLRASFPSYDVELVGGVFAKPCVIEFPGNAELEEGHQVLRVMHKPEMDMGPIELRGRRENILRFTPAQIEAIHSAGCEGLTLVVGPPGSGKTDVAVQTISNLYHAHPRQTILLVTHSNQALNQLFAKIIDLDIEPRHLLRLGHGEGELDSDERYSKAGRVDSYLERRSVLLAEVQRLADSLGLGTTAADFAYTCENARFFFISHVRVRWEQYRRKVLDAQPPDASKIVEAFPFVRFIEEQLGHPLFGSNSEDEENADTGKLADTAYGCFRYIESIFDELADIQPFELLRGHSERSNYLLTNQARIVAMTCTHAALKRGELLRLGFRYDTVVMEEAAQVLDIESLIPLTLQRQPKQPTGNTMDVGSSRRRLKRLVMIGDHNQLPPVIRNTGLRSYANMEQSMFTRLIRLNVPYIELNMQARARPQLASLYRFRYHDLGDLIPNVSERAFSRPNPGFLHELQFVDVGDFGKHRGESEPTSHFYQNVGEAEYVVAVYQYMRLLGYPADRIAILTTYNGQRALIRDVLERRCGWLAYFGYPAAVSTVDQFQGQQADYILLSLVRTKNVGHIRDLRRLTVALSRARLGLYVFARKSLFESCFELKSTMKRLLANGDCLELCNQERFDLEQESTQQRETVRVEDVKAMGHLVHKMIEEHIAYDNHIATEDNSDVDMADSSDSSPDNAVGID